MKKLLCFLLVMAMMVSLNACCACLPTDFFGGTQIETPPDSPVTIPCTALRLGTTYHVFTLETERLQLDVQTVPADTTDILTYISSDPSVASVDKNGLVTPGTKKGSTIIMVACGNVSQMCMIMYTPETVTEPTTPSLPPVTEPTTPPAPALPDGFVLKLHTYKDSGELSINGGDSILIYTETMGIKASDITWSSSDPTIATVENGKVTGVEKGICVITATIGDQTATCRVFCISDAKPASDYWLNIEDVTIHYGETISLALSHEETGDAVQGLVWQADKTGVVTINGNKITGNSLTSYTTVNVFTEYEGITYTCVVHVTAAN